MEKLKNIILGFAPSAKAEKFVEKFKSEIHGPNHTAFILNRHEAEEMFVPERGESTMSGNLIRFFQKHIGGGPAEFIRDLKRMSSDDRLVVIETEDLDDDQIETVRSLAKSSQLIQAKHFGDFSVEHLTFSKDHEAEML